MSSIILSVSTAEVEDIHDAGIPLPTPFVADDFSRGDSSNTCKDTGIEKKKDDEQAVSNDKECSSAHEAL